MLSSNEIEQCKLLQHEIRKLNDIVINKRSYLKDLQERCDHSKLPKRTLAETYMDTCPDCGHVNYCYCIG